MLAVNYTTLRDNMKTYMDRVTDDYETMIVTRKNNKNIVMLSEETYNNLMENIYVMGNKANYDWLMESKAQLEAGKSVAHELIEVEDDEYSFFGQWMEGLPLLGDRGSKNTEENQ